MEVELRPKPVDYRHIEELLRRAPDDRAVFLKVEEGMTPERLRKNVQMQLSRRSEVQIKTRVAWDGVYVWEVRPRA